MQLFSRIDLKLLLPVVFLTLIGSVILSSVQPAIYPQQFIFLFLAFLVFLIFTHIEVGILRNFAPFLYVFSLLLLLVTILFGVLTRGSVRWIDLGFITLQPSELVKPFLLLAFASIIAGSNKTVKFVLAFLALTPAILLILVQPDLGSSLVVLAGFLGVIFLGGVPVRYLLVVGILGAISSPLLWHVLASYQKERIFSFLNPGSDPLSTGYNAIQSVIAIGSGGFFGKGLGQGTQSHLAFLPERHTDFIFASLSEELGFLGASLVVIAFGVLLWRIVVLIKNSHDVFSKALLGGIFGTLLAQSGINIGMNLGLLPITGIPLPFVSSGGSSLIATSIILGMASSISSDHEKQY